MLRSCSIVSPCSPGSHGGAAVTQEEKRVSPPPESGRGAAAGEAGSLASHSPHRDRSTGASLNLLNSGGTRPPSPTKFLARARHISPLPEDERTIPSAPTCLKP